MVSVSLSSPISSLSAIFLSSGCLDFDYKISSQFFLFTVFDPTAVLIPCSCCLIRFFQLLAIQNPVCCFSGFHLLTLSISFLFYLIIIYCQVSPSRGTCVMLTLTSQCLTISYCYCLFHSLWQCGSLDPSISIATFKWIFLDPPLTN